MNKSQQKYILVIRSLAFGVVAFLWYLSIIWSADGFSINDPELRWIGIGLALSVTVVQLVFNRGSANPTIFLVGLAAYIYGFATNFIGISKVIGLEFTTANFTQNAFGFIVSGLGVIALSLIVEAAPESFLLWALYPEEKTPGDFISSLFKGINLPNNRSRPGFNLDRSKERSNVPSFVPERSNVSFSPVEERVKQYYIQQTRKGSKPSYSDIVKNVRGVNSKSQVKPILDKLGLK